MKKEDLTIGNWVYVAHQHSNIDGDYDLEFIPEKLTLEHFKFWAENDWNNTDFDEFLKPITITTDILEKNEFKKYCSDIYKLNNEEIYIEKFGKAYWIGKSIQTNKIYGDFVQRCVCVTYLHELQNVIKLFGFNKDIKP